MKNKKWKEFKRLTRDCYLSIAVAEKNHGCWNKAFDVLMEVITDERNGQPKYALELYQLDEITDYEYDVQGWLEDYLDELDMSEEYDRLLEVCDVLLEMFQWKEDKPADIKLKKAVTLDALGKKKEALEFCEQWLKEEADNVAAVTANIYANLAIRNMEEAESLIKQYIHNDTECTEENDILFIAASTYYQVTGNKKEKKRIDKAIGEYEKRMEQYFFGEDAFFMNDGEVDEVFIWDDEELPFQ